MVDPDLARKRAYQAAWVRRKRAEQRRVAGMTLGELIRERRRIAAEAEVQFEPKPRKPGLSRSKQSWLTICTLSLSMMSFTDSYSILPSKILSAILGL